MTWFRRLLLTFGGCFCFVLFAFSKVYLVSVGISNYPGADKDLRLPASDARAMIDVYRSTSNAEFCLLLDSVATKANITAAMKKLFGKAKKDDTILLFYSGHGYYGGFYVYDGYMGYDEVRKGLAKVKCKTKMIFADACYSGKIRNNSSSPSENSNLKSSNIMLFLSSRNNETSLESSIMENGFFTHYLKEALMEHAADLNKDNVITAMELYRYVHKSVIERTNQQQHPVMWGRFPHDMVVLSW